MGVEMNPIYNEKALTIDGNLIIADLHIGIEHGLSKTGVKIPSQIQKMEDRILGLLSSTNSKSLIILGDLKHNIPRSSLQEYREIPELVDELSGRANVTLVKGNHDGNIERIVPGVEVVKHLEIGDALLTHGHSWPEEVNFGHVIMGHNHPCIEFEDEFGRRSREAAWIRTRFNEKIRDFYDLKMSPEVVIMPAFNDLISGNPFNRGGQKDLLGPFFKKETIDLTDAKAYLLDGTFLGKIGDLRGD